MDIFDQIVDAYNLSTEGNRGPLDDVIEAYGLEEVEAVIEEYTQGGGSSGGQTQPSTTQGGVMTRDGLPPKERTGAVDTSLYPTKGHYVSDPTSPGYDPSSPWYNDSLDPSFTGEEKKKKSSNKLLWAAAALFGFAAFM